MDVGVSILEKIARDVPRLEDAPPDDRVKRDPVDNDAVEALDDLVAALEPEEDDVAAAPHARDGVVHARRLAAHLERNVDPHAVGKVADLAGQLGVVDVGACLEVLRREDVVGAQLPRLFGVRRHGLDADDQPRSERLGDRDGEEADRAASDDGDALSAEVHLGACVDCVAEGLLQRGDLGANAARVGAPEGAGGELHVLGEAAVGGDADDEVVGADVVVAGAALVAGAADDVALGRDYVARLVAELARRHRPDRHDLAEELVAHHALVLVIAVEPLVDHVSERSTKPDAPVATAEAGVLGADEDHPAVVVVLRLVEHGPLDLGPAHAGALVPRVSRAVVGQGPHGVVHAGGA